MVIHRPLKPYTPKNHVYGFCVPSGSREKLICESCASESIPLDSESPWGGAWFKVREDAVAVTFDGRVNCADCHDVLQGPSSL